MPIIIRVHASKNGPSYQDVQQAVKDANHLQGRVRFVLEPDLSMAALPSGEVTQADLEQAFAAPGAALDGVIFCDRKFTQHSVFECLPDRVYVSGSVARGKSAPVFRLYALYQLAAAIMTVKSGLSELNNREMMHQPPIGCLWDWWTTVQERERVMLMARVCPDCEDSLHNRIGARAERLDACRRILTYVRRATMKEVAEVPVGIFIAYGHTRDWEDLKAMIESWGLEVEDFNSTNGTITERWRTMLDRSRFAFIVMTADDPGARARQNVIHEIGLCQGRLGLENTAIFVAKDVDLDEITNVAGILYHSFVPGQLSAQAPAIRQLLEARGILYAAH